MFMCIAIICGDRERSFGECSVESTETTGESGVLTGSSYEKQLAPSSPVKFASKIGIHHFINARRFKWRSIRWPENLLTNQCW